MDLLVHAGREDKTQSKNGSWIFFLRQLFSCSVVILHYFVFGMYVGAPTVIIPQMIKEANSTDIITSEAKSWLSSISFWSAIPWIFIWPLLSYHFGRKICVVLISITALLANIFFYCSTSVVELIISFGLLGMPSGSIVTIAIMVSSEYTSPKYRGIFLMLKTASFYWGIWVGNVIGTFFQWKNIGIVAFVCDIYCMATIFYKESPYWLASKGRFDECAKIHRWLKGTNEDSENELKKLISSQKLRLRNKVEVNLLANVKKHIKFINIVRSKCFYKPLTYGFVLVLLYGLSGKLACTIYAIDILKKITSSERLAYQAMLILDAVTVASMYCGSVLPKFVTRRKQLIVFSSIGIGFLYMLSIYLYLIQLNVITERNYVSLFFLIGFSISMSCGPIILVPCCASELSPLRCRSYYLCSIAIVKNFTLALILKISPLIVQICGTPGLFLFFALSSSVCIFIINKYLPETKDKTIQEIEELVTGGNAYTTTNDTTTLTTESIALKKFEAA